MEFQDRTLRCADCGSDFVWTAGEQAFFADKRFTNEPKRCKACKTKRVQRRTVDPASGHDRTETRATCSACGKETTVPFRPSQGRPVYCRDCFQQRKPRGPHGA
jgi:CxxC-x17-CxxC domain-containing protein